MPVFTKIPTNWKRGTLIEECDLIPREKCKVLTVSENTIERNFYVACMEIILSACKAKKDLGILVFSNLKWCHVLITIAL